MTSRKPSTNEPNQNLNGQPVTPEETNYRDGYVQGQASEQRYQGERDRASESNGAAAGLLIGTLIAALAGGAIALFYYNSQDRQPDVIVQPTTAPAASPSPQAQQSPSPQPQRTTIIQRTIERQVPAPAPEINIQAPAPAPAAPAAPAPAAQSAPPAAPEAAPQTAPPAAQNNAQPQPPEPAAPDQASGQSAP